MQSNRTAWTLVGLLGCLAVCLLMVFAGVSAYWFWGLAQSTAVVVNRETASPMPRTPTALASRHYDHVEFTFDYPSGYETFADFWTTGFGFPYKPGYDKEFDANGLGGVLMPLGPNITGDKYLTSVHVYHKVLPPGSSLAKVYAQAYSEQTYSGQYAKSNLISDRTVTVDGVTAFEKVYRKPSGEPWFQVREVWLEKNGKIYILSCRTVPTWFDQHQPDFNLIVDSFHVKPIKSIEFPKDKLSCETAGGKWGRIGTSPREQCNLPTSDAGRVCSDSNECEGFCIAELSKADQERVMRDKAIITTTGKCAPWRITVGCIPVVEQGKVRGLLCID